MWFYGVLSTAPSFRPLFSLSAGKVRKFEHISLTENSTEQGM